MGCVFLSRTGIGERTRKGFTHTYVPTWGLQTHTQSCTHCQSKSFASADSHQEIPAAIFSPFPSTLMRLISHSTSYLSHLSAFVLVSFIISAVNTSAIAAAQCEVPALKESHSNVRCARLKNLTLLSCWMTHKVKVAQGIDKMSFNSQPGNTWSSSQFWNIKMLNVKIL